MKTSDEIEKKIKELQEEIQELHDEREKKKNNCELFDEENLDIISDITYKWSEISTLQWVLS